MRHRIFSASLLLLGFGMLAGCGQKGPLVLPPPKTSVVAPSPAASAAKPAAAATAAAPASASSNG